MGEAHPMAKHSMGGRFHCSNCHCWSNLCYRYWRCCCCCCYQELDRWERMGILGQYLDLWMKPGWWESAPIASEELRKCAWTIPYHVHNQKTAMAWAVAWYCKDCRWQIQHWREPAESEFGSAVASAGTAQFQEKQEEDSWGSNHHWSTVCTWIPAETEQTAAVAGRMAEVVALGVGQATLPWR